MIFTKPFLFQAQYDAMDCGPACLKMVADYHGRNFTLSDLRERSYLTRNGVNLLGISEAAQSIGLRTLAVAVPLSKLLRHTPFPCIIHWQQNHFIVLYKVKGRHFFVADPGKGRLRFDRNDFLKGWNGGHQDKNGIALLLEPAPSSNSTIEQHENPSGIKKRAFLLRYIKPYKLYIYQLFLAMLAGSGLSLLPPVFTRRIVDEGIHKGNLTLVQLILIAQLIVFLGSISMDLIKGWILLHLNSRINVTIISDFLMKLMGLPIGYFDSKLTGDIKQRIADHSRIQSFLTGSALSSLFSLVNLILYTIVLACYSINILGVFFIFSALGIGWILLFLKKRKSLDYIRFQQMSENESILFEVITGMQEIKLNNCEKMKRWQWERVQASMFAIGLKGLALGQYQQSGTIFIGQLKNIFISYLAAAAVIKGDITLGTMMSISYIIGQLNGPVQSLLSFVQSAQDAKISLERLAEVHNNPSEEKKGLKKHFPDMASRGIQIQNASHQYTGPDSPFVLRDVCLQIPEGKVTAIVGPSGGGKTTLIKMLLNFYSPAKGYISVNGVPVNELSPSFWRSQCGIVMQEGLIFGDTIAKNITMSDEKEDEERLNHAIEVANIKDFIESLPLGLQTQIGTSGMGISTGQKQRLLIARAVYKNPSFIFLDEATSALDANNEKVIINNLQQFYKGRTVVIVAHRLSTVKHADQIVVLDNGVIRETGSHDDLLEARGQYFELIKNQLEILNS